MTSSTVNPPAPNLATLLLIKRKMAASNGQSAGEKQALQPTPAVIGSHSNEKITYRQDMPVENPAQTTTLAATDSNEPPKVSRKTKQLEVNLLDKKMNEINRKQEATTNETLDTWKGFDSLNYGFGPDSEAQKTTTSVPSAPPEQRTSTPSPVKTPEKSITQTPVREQPAEKQTSRQSTPKPVDSPIKDRPRSKSPVKEEQPRKETPPQQKQPSPPPPPPEENVYKQPPPSPPRESIIEKQPSPPPPPPRRSKINSTSPLEKPKTQEDEQPKSSTPIIENIIPISSIISNPKIFEKHAQSFEYSPLPTPANPNFKLFPDIKASKKAQKSIQRSMDRYRFHVW